MVKDIAELVEDFEYLAETNLESYYNNHLDWVARVRSYATTRPQPSNEVRECKPSADVSDVLDRVEKRYYSNAIPTTPYSRTILPSEIHKIRQALTQPSADVDYSDYIKRTPIHMTMAEMMIDSLKGRLGNQVYLDALEDHIKALQSTETDYLKEKHRVVKVATEALREISKGFEAGCNKIEIEEPDKIKGLK